MSSPPKADEATNASFKKEFDKKVIQAIKERRRNPRCVNTFSYPERLTHADLSRLLEILMTARLGFCNINVPWYLAERPQEFIDRLEAAYVKGSFATLIEDPDMPPDFRKGLITKTLKDAFETPFLGTTDKLFIETLNRERKSNNLCAVKRPYHLSISVIQSSGTGKSRMAQEVANTVFTIPMNLRDPEYKKVFPPPDFIIRKYFKDRENFIDERQEVDYALLLQALFKNAGQLVQKHWPGIKGPELARKWNEYLKVGQTEDESGPNRRAFLSAAVSDARWKRAVLGLTRRLTLDSLESSLQQSCTQLCQAVALNHDSRTNELFVVFDEAQTLIRPYQDMKARSEVKKDTPNHSAFHNLGTTMTVFTGSPVFFIFMSASPHPKPFAPLPSPHPSVSLKTGSQIIPPFNELPFDLHRGKVLSELGPPTLEKMCKTEVVVASGRPLWYSIYHTFPDEDIYTLALNELVAGRAEDRKKDAAIAALAVRIGIPFDRSDTTSLDIQSRLVASHMRVVYSIPRHQEYMDTGYPSEPVLAEASGRYFAGPGQNRLSIVGPAILADICNDMFVARGERAGLVSRLIAICAYEDALDNYFATRPYRSFKEPHFHHPLPLLFFIRSLFHQEQWQVVLNAKPTSNKDESIPLCEAFSESHIFFSHFAPARDLEMLRSYGLASSLTRGMALQTTECQESVDAVIPIHMGSLTTPISPNTTSCINLQFKNRKKPEECYNDQIIAVSDELVPTLSIVFELGVDNKKSGIVEVKHRGRSTAGCTASRAHYDDYHYKIVVYGCNSKSFGAIPPQVQEMYQEILQTSDMMADFPRQANLEALDQLNPSFSGALEKARDSHLFST
ncbi:Serine/threonine-protein kinase [Ceratobasidium sp. AG-Ba]|nr:Serine/threonine-protein kinase [Ceratobasidium sp. AG-Ba]